MVTGFIGATEDGRTTTIGRDGSDYSAAIVGAALGVGVIEIWTDVDGILSADPRAVKSAFVVPQMSYEEAMELSYFGAKVLHSSTIAPAVVKHIPIIIKNTLNPSAPGTRISRHVDRWEGVAKGDHIGGSLYAADDPWAEDGRGPGNGGAIVPVSRFAQRQRHPNLPGVIGTHDLYCGQQCGCWEGARSGP